jgi:hypothetical protein
MTGPRQGEAGSGMAGQYPGMRLNQASADPTESHVQSGAAKEQEVLASSPAQKKAAARAIEEHIEPDTRKAGDWADHETNEAVKAFRGGWLTSEALKKAHEAWGEQVENLLNRLASEKAALRSVNSALHTADIQAGEGVRSVSVIDRY